MAKSENATRLPKKPPKNCDPWTWHKARAVDRYLARLARAWRHLEYTRDRMAEARAGYAPNAVRYDKTRTTGGDHSDPTPRAAERIAGASLDCIKAYSVYLRAQYEAEELAAQVDPPRGWRPCSIAVREYATGKDVLTTAERVDALAAMYPHLPPRYRDPIPCAL